MAEPTTAEIHHQVQGLREYFLLLKPRAYGKIVTSSTGFARELCEILLTCSCYLLANYSAISALGRKVA